jgi:methyl-accepting chemotaxis protein
MMNNTTSQVDPKTDSSTATEDALVDIQQIIRELQSTNRDAEGNFLMLGEGLQNLFHESTEMTSSAQMAVNTISREHNISEIIQQISDRILTRFNDVKLNNLKILTHATGASALIRELAGKTPEIRKIDKELWILGSNMAIQASWNPHTRKMFGDYSEELKQFSKSIKKVFLQFQIDLKGMNDSIQELHSSIRSETQRLDELINQSRQNIQNATQQLEQLLRDSAEKIGFIEDLSRKMTRRVADIVTSIQFNDITRQQVEHVIEALADTSSGRNTFEIYRSMRIQSAQLDQVTETLAGAIETIEHSFSDIIRSGADIASQYRQPSGAPHSDSPFARIKTALHEQEGLLNFSSTLRDRTIQSMQIASVAADRLASHLDEIGEITGELNLQAINALVMSRNIGQGGASLVALSKEVHTLSKESTHTVEQVVNILTEIGTQTSELSSLASENTEWDNSQQLKDGFDQIDHIGEQYFSAIDNTATLSNQLQIHARRTNEKSGFIEKLSERIQTSNTHLTDAAEKLAAHAVQDEGDQANMKERYTMESERLIHDRVQQELNGQSASDLQTSSTVTSRAPSEEPDEDSEFGDFELF